MFRKLCYWPRKKLPDSVQTMHVVNSTACGAHIATIPCISEPDITYVPSL